MTFHPRRAIIAPMRRFNLVFQKYILFWALLAMVAGYLAGKFNHERVLSLAFLITPCAVLMMFIMVFPSNLSSLAKLKRYIYPVLMTFFLLLSSPFIAALVSFIIPEQFLFLRTGIVISATVPPNAMLSAWTGFLEGDILLTLIQQSFSSLVSLLFMPFTTAVLFRGHYSSSLYILIRNLFFLVVIPFIFAALCKKIFRRYLTEELLRRTKPTLSSISGIIELFVILLSVGLNAYIISDYPIMILYGVLTAALYYIISLLISVYLVKFFRFRYEVAVPLIYQNGTRNLSVAMVVAITSFKGQAILGVAACILAQFPVSALFYSIIVRLRRDFGGAPDEEAA